MSKICPLRYATEHCDTALIVDNPSEYRCLEEKCAWWIRVAEKMGKCSIEEIAEGI